jgi:HEAT repeat protein
VNIALVKNSAEMIWRALCLGLTCFFVFACSKPAESPSADREPNLELRKPVATPENEPAPTIVPPAAADRSLEQPTPGADESPAQTAASLRQKFLNAQDANERTAILQALGELENAEAVAVLGFLFQNERDEELKLDMLATLEQMEVANAPKMPIVAAALRPEQPQSVREAAIDALVDLDEPGALQMLQSLTTDPNPEIRDAAKDALQSALETKQRPPAP